MKPKLGKNQALKVLDKAEALEMVVDDINKRLGKGTIQPLAMLPALAFRSTGVSELDDLLGGGLPMGRIVEVFGLKGSGRTPFAASLVKNCSVLWIDAEMKMTPEFGAVLGLPHDAMVARPNSLEDCFEIILEALDAGVVDAIVVDSLPALPVAKEMEERDMSKPGVMAPTANFLSRKLGKVVHELSKSGATLIIINQQRDNTNMASAFAERYHTFGGRALAYYATLRLATARTAWLKRKVKGEEVIDGASIAVLIDKSSVSTATPRKGTELILLYGAGVIAHDDMKEQRNLLTAGWTREAVVPDNQTVVTELDDMIEGGINGADLANE